MQPNRGPAAAARSERSRTKRVAAFHGGKSTGLKTPAPPGLLKVFFAGRRQRYWIREMEGALAGLLKFLVRSRLAWRL